MTDYHANALEEALRRVAGGQVPAAAFERLAGQASAVAAQLQQAVLADVGAFAKSRNPELLPELNEHCRAHVAEIVRLLRHGGPALFEFVRAQACRRAEQHFPMEATLHAYRSGQKVLSRWLRESPLSAGDNTAKAQQTVSAIADFAMEYTDAISTTFASAYAAHSLRLAEVAGDQRTQLLRILLSGRDEADPYAARILREAGFVSERPMYCVALAQSVDPTEMLNPARARRMAEAIEQIVADLPLRRVIDIHDNKVTMIFTAVSRDSGWTAPRSSLARQVRAALQRVGIAALIGVSNDVPSTSHIPTAHKEATAALGMASVAERVMQFADIPLRQLLLHFASHEFHRVMPAWSVAFREADARSGGALAATLRAYAAADMNILKAAQSLGVHPNTIYARFQRIQDISGLQPRAFGPLGDLLLVCDFMHTAAAEPALPRQAAASGGEWTVP